MSGLPPEQDAYGREIWDCYQGAEMFEIVERDDGFIDCARSNYFMAFEDWPEHQKRAFAHAHGRVLDIGLGAGRVCLHCQDLGLDALGIDVSPLAVKTAKHRGVRRAKVLSITEITGRLGAFDTIVMYGNNFGLFANPRRARWLLRRFRSMTSPDAVLIAESNDIYFEGVPGYHLEYQRWNRERGRMSGQIRLRVRYQRYATPWFDYLMVSPDEMRGILDGTGWRVRELYPSDGPSYAAVIEKST